MTSEAEELRAEYLAEAQDDLAGNEPGSFGCHELLDRTSILADQIDSQVLSHPACIQNSEWFALAHQAMTALHDLYQAVGAEHLSVEEKPKANGQPTKRVKVAS